MNNLAADITDDYSCSFSALSLCSALTSSECDLPPSWYFCDELIQTLVNMSGYMARSRSVREFTQIPDTAGQETRCPSSTPKPSSSQSGCRFGFRLDGGWSPARVSGC